MLKKGSLVTFIFIVSTFIQLVSQIIVTRIFGATLQLDIFLAAVALPTTIVTVIYATLNDALLPMLGEKKVKAPEEFNSFFSLSLFALTILSLVFELAFILLSHLFISLLYQSRGEAFVLEATRQMRFMSLSFPISIIATICGSYFYVRKEFTKFPIAQLIGSLANVVLIVLLIPTAGIWALVISFVVNILFQIIFCLPPLKVIQRNIGELSRNFKFELKSLLLAWIPLTIGYFALRNDTLLIRSFGSYMPTGYLVYLNLISKIFSLATSVMTIGIQIVLLPQLVEDFANKNYKKAIADVRKSKIFSFLISVGVTGLTLIMTPFVINLIFVGGKFSRTDGTHTLNLMWLFVVPAIGWGINSVFFQPLIALKKQKQLGILNVLSFVSAWSIASITKTYFGPEIAISAGLITLLFTGIIGSEILWQQYKRKLTSSQ